MSRIDEMTRFTAADSIACKCSAVETRYFRNSFLPVVKRRLERTGKKFARRSPIMHRGYYARMEGQMMAIERFLAATAEEPRRQVLFLGGGFDAISPQLLHDHAQSASAKSNYDNLHIFEVDFMDIIQQKFEIYSTENSILKAIFSPLKLAEDNAPPAANPPTLQPQRISNSIFGLGPLTLIAQDLRMGSELVQQLDRAGFDPSMPTLVITECVLVYLEADHTLQLIQSMHDYLRSGRSMWISYDMIKADDTYGKMMMQNLSRAGFSLPGFQNFLTLQAHEEKFQHSNWIHAKAIDMLQFYHRVIEREKIEKIQKLEILDEVEEWNMIMSHYSMTLAANCDDFYFIVNELTTLRPHESSPIKFNMNSVV